MLLLFFGCRPTVGELGGPSAVPDRVILTWNGDPATSQSVTWRTDHTVTAGQAQIAKSLASPDLGSAATLVSATTETLRLRDSNWNDALPESVSYHSATFGDLEPSTLYAYRVGQGDAWSEWHHFRTASDDPEEPFRFLYFGDAQNGVLTHWSRVLRTAYRFAPDAAFAIHAGDLVNEGHADAEWSEWYTAGAWLHATLPAIPVTGNHEYRSMERGSRENRRLSMLWRPQFALPRGEGVPTELAETVYWLDYQGARVFVLNSNRSPEQQVLWLEEALAATEARWKIVTFHHPLFSNAGSRDNPELRELWLPVLERWNVDLVLQGHDHTYSRGQTAGGQDGVEQGEPAPGGAPSQTPVDGAEVGTVIVVSVSGAKQYELADDLWSGYDGQATLARAAENTQLFHVIEVGPARIDYRAYGADGQLYDAFELRKDEAGTKRLLDLSPDLEERRFESTAPYTSGHWTTTPG